MTISRPRIEDDLLQRFLDDEIDPETEAETLAEIEAALDESDVDRGRKLAVERLGDFVRSAVAEDEASLSADESRAMFEAILRGMEEEEASESIEKEIPEQVRPETGKRKKPKLRLIEGEGLGTLPPKTERIAFQPKLGPDASPADAQEAEHSSQSVAPMAGGEDEGRRTVAPGIFAVVALAAAALLAIFARPEPPAPTSASNVTDPVVQTEDEAPVIVEPSEPPVTEIASLGSEVVEVDFGENIGTVFQVPGEQNVPVAVVWLSDEELTQ